MPALSLIPQPAHADVATGDVIFTRQQSTGMDHIMRSSGGTVTDLSTGLNSDLTDDEPAISSDGSQIAFIGLRPVQSHPELYPRNVLMIKNSDGSGEDYIHIPTYDSSRTPAYTPFDNSPRWSPDGQHIAYVKDSDAASESGIWSYDTTGRSDVQLTSGGDEFDPFWSPDGAHIVYTGLNTSTGENQLYIMDAADGASKHLLAGSDSGYGDMYPSWSPDGQRIYFASTQDYGVYYYESSSKFASGTPTRTHLSVDGPGGDPRVMGVSRDGNTLAYANNVVRIDPNDPNNTCAIKRVFTISSSGGTPTQVTDGAGCTTVDVYPSFVQNAWPPTYCSTTTICISAPSPSDAPYTRQVTIGLSSSGVKEFQYCWSTVGIGSAPDSTCSSHVQTSTDLTNKKGTLNYLGVYSGSGTTWYDSTEPNSDYYLWVRSVQTNGTANSWNGGGSNTPLRVHTPKQPVWVGVGDSYTSGHNQLSDEPRCPDPSESVTLSDYYREANIACDVDGGPHYTKFDPDFSWVSPAVINFNNAQHVPSAWSLIRDDVAMSGMASSQYGHNDTTPGTDDWATGDNQAAQLRGALYPRYDSWNVVSMTGGADDVSNPSWASKFEDWYSNHLSITVGQSVAPWDVATSNPSADCPDSNTLYGELTANSGALSDDIQANLQGVADLSARLAPGSRVLNVGYPYIADYDDSASASNDCSFDSGSWKGSRSVIDKLNDAHEAVTGDNTQYLDLTKDSGLGKDPVANGYLQLTRFYGYPHASADGQSRIAVVADSALNGTGWAEGGTDYATNGSFESGSAGGWNDTTPNATPSVSTVAHSGSNAMTLAYTSDVTDSPNLIDANTSSAVGIDPVDFWAKGPSGKTIRVKLRQYLPGGNNELYQSFTLEGNWDHFVTKALHVFPGYSVDLNFDTPGASSGDVFYLDDIHEYGYASTEDCGYQNLVNGLNADAVENCGGEAPYGTQYWAAADSANPTLTSDTADAHDGLYSFKLVAANSGTMSMNDSPDARDTGEVSSSATSCTATAWLKGPSAGGSRSLKLRVREYNASQGGLMGTATSSGLTPNGSWQQVSITRTLASGHDGNTHIDLYAYMTNASTNDVVRVDHITETCQ